jgi:hypothetical protein
MDCKDDPPVVPPIIPPDSTLQEFTIQVFEVGAPHTFQITNDIWVFDKNNIWVVGDFYFSDSTVSGGTRESNIIRWDGKKWHQFGGILNSSGIYGITFINEFIGFLSLGGIIKIENNTLIPQSLTGLTTNPNHSIRKMWASSESNVWGVGLDGFVVHYDGTSWKKLNFPEGWNFGSISGSMKNGFGYAIASSIEYDIIVELRPDSAFILTTYPAVNYALDAYTLTDSTLFVSGNPSRIFNLKTKKDSVIHSFNNPWPQMTAFHAQNDIMWLMFDNVNRKYSLRHFNGNRYRNITLSQQYSEQVFYHGSYASNNVFAFVGDADNGNSIILLLTR